jgi:caspase domain-containing protein
VQSEQPDSAQGKSMIRSLLITGLLFMFSNQTWAAWPEGEVVPFGLLVANNEGGQDLEKLRYAQRDAEKVRDVFVDLGNLSLKRTTMVLGGSADDVVEAMQDLQAQIKQAVQSGMTVMLVFYYSGHAKDGQLILDDSRLAMSRVKDWLKNSPADMRVAFIDACQAGEITRMKGGTLAPSMVKIEHTKGQIIVTSSSATEGSQESDEIGGSFFTHYLTSGLRGAADQSGDGAISLREVYEYSYNQTVNRTAGTRGGTQHPTYGYQVAGRGEIILTRLSTPSCGINFPKELNGNYLIYDLEKHHIVAEVTKVQGQACSIAVSPGMFAVKKRRENDLLLGEYALEAGQHLTVKDEELREVAFEDDITKGLVVIREKTKYLGYSLRFGGQAFFDAPTRRDLFYSSLQAGLQIEFFGVMANWVSIALDVLLGGGNDSTQVELDGGTSQRVDAKFFRAEIGVAMHFHLDWEWFGLYAGPRLSFLITSRRFGEPLERWPSQTFSTISPGISAGMAFHFGNIDLFLEGRVHYLYYNVEGSSSLGYGGAYLGIAYRY